MAFHLFKKQESTAHNFQNDPSLHDDTTQDAPSWLSSIPGDAAAIVKNLPVLRSQGKEQFAKYIAGSLELNDPLSKLISKKLVSMLWGSLLHPPSTYQGLEYRYRTPDGSNNSVLYPHLGKAGLPYAKSVPGKRALLGAKPDPGDIFDLLCARKGDGEESKSGISMMLLYHATIIIHDIFRTDDFDSNASATSSYLDLAPLYGNSRKEQESVRQMRDGLLKPDTFAETRLLGQPPGVCIYIIMYNRFHNYVAEQLKEINEHGRFSLPPDVRDNEEYRQDAKYKDFFKQQDEHLFQTARLVTCGMYINIAIHDYLRCLMGVHTIDTPWTLDPRAPFPETDNKKGLDRGEGNMVSCEFSLLYRFHSPISRRDAAWAEDLFITKMSQVGMVDDSGSAAAKEAIKKGKKWTSQMIKDGELPVSVLQNFIRVAKMTSADKAAENAAKKYFPDGLDNAGFDTGKKFRFERGPDGKFDTAQLAAEMCRAIEDPICQFGAQQTPKVFRSIDIMGMLQARKWEIATLNEYREFFGMSRFKTFEEINSDKEIANNLRKLYEDPDCVEFFPGLFCEGIGRNLDPGAKMPNDAQSSLWRGVFSDAVTLVRSDRFYTLDWNVGSLTAWGMKEVTSEPHVNKGSVMHRLFQRAFPGCFEYNSVHMWQPFYTPSMNLQLAHDQGYLKWLDLRGLEDNSGKLHKFSTEKEQVYYGPNKQAFGKFKAQVAASGVRRRLTLGNDPSGTRWRGNEYVQMSVKPKVVSCYKTIKEEILGGPNSMNWANPAIVNPGDVPEGPLRKIMTKQWSDWGEAIGVVNKTLPQDWEQIVTDYFVGVSQDIRLREQKALQHRKDGTQIYQLDIVKDLSIPVITRFMADLMGFWQLVKTEEYPSRKYDENEIYQHIDNCQNFEAYDSDPTKAWRRRMDFQDSIKVLKSLADAGVAQNRTGWLEYMTRSYGSTADGHYTHELRKLGVSLTQALLNKYHDGNLVAAIMLHTALDAIQRFVLTFSEVMAYFVDPTRRKTWKIDEKDAETHVWNEFKKKAWSDTKETKKETKDGEKVGIAVPKNGKNDLTTFKVLEQYVREAARFSNPPTMARVYEPLKKETSKKTSIVVDHAKSKEEVVEGELVLLNTQKAYEDPEAAVDNPTEFKLREAHVYIGYGPTLSVTKSGAYDPPRFSKRTSIIGITALIKHCAFLGGLRIAHDKAGRLKRVKTPDGYVRYATPQWDRLVAFPTTWAVRFDDIGEETYTGNDNADQGHGQNQIVDDIDYGYSSLIQQQNIVETNKEQKKKREEADIQKRIDEAVAKAVAEALTKVSQQDNKPGMKVSSKEVAASAA